MEYARIRECQCEIRRLRSAVRDYAKSIEAWSHFNASDLFEIWRVYDDVTAKDEVLQITGERQLGLIDGISYLAFCYGYEKAIEKLRGAL